MDKRIMQSNLVVNETLSYGYAKYTQLDAKYMERFKRINSKKAFVR
ncbi:hypothetical protein [uncultured Clostridium sp.]